MPPLYLRPLLNLLAIIFLVAAGVQGQVPQVAQPEHSDAQPLQPMLQNVSLLNEVMRAIPESDKITLPEQLRSNFAGSSDGRVRVAVTITGAIAGGQAVDWTAEASRSQHRAAVRLRQNAFRQRLSPMEHSVVGMADNFEVLFMDVTLTGLAELLVDPDVSEVVPEFFVKRHDAQGIPLMNASMVRSSYDGTGLSIAIIDDGIDYGHPRLGNGSFPNEKVIGGRDFTTNKPNAVPFQNTFSHGTSCAGIAAGDTGPVVGDYIGGVAPSARLYALKVFPNSGGGASSQHIFNALDWSLTNQNADPNNPIMVASLSLGGGRYYDACDATWTSFGTLIGALNAAGITVLSSSGNEGLCDSMGWPACMTNIISIGAAYDASFGNYLPCMTAESCHTGKISTTGCSSDYYVVDSSEALKVTAYSNSASFLDIVAPANQAYTTDNVGSYGYASGDYYSSFGGTSAACPYAAGVVAVLQHAHRVRYGTYATPAVIRTYLTRNGIDVTDTKGGAISITKPFIDAQASFNAFFNTPELLVEDEVIAEEIVNGGTFNLGTAEQGSAPLTKAIRVRNSPPAGVTAELITGNFTLSEEFETEDVLPSSIAAGDSVLMTISLPTTTFGEFSGTLSFTTNDSRKSSFSIIITGQILENNPYDVQLSATSVEENAGNDTIIGTITATDPDHTTGFTYALLENSSGRFKIAADELQVANGSLFDHESSTSHAITIQATNPDALSFQKNFIIQVLDVNEAPTVSGIPPPATINEKELYTFTAAAADPDTDDPLTFSLLNAPVGAAIGESSGILIWTPTEEQGDDSTYNFSILVTDSGSPALSDSKPLSLTVLDVNSSPTITVITNKAILAGQELSFTATAFDADLPAQALTFNLDGPSLALGMSIGSESGAFSWNPTFTHFLGGPVYEATVTVGDGGFTDSTTFTITVLESNQAPTNINLSTSEINEGLFGEAVGTLTTSDPNIADTHVYTMTSNPGSFFAINDSTLKTNAYLEPGEYWVEIQTRDQGGTGLTFAKPFTIIIAAVADADGDQIANAVEGGAPGGDGNNDGVPDKYQPHVVSLPDIGGTDYLTLVAPAGVGISNVHAQAATALPDGLLAPLGSISFALSPVDLGQEVIVQLIWQAELSNSPIVGHYRLSEAEWYSFLFDGTDGADQFDNGNGTLRIVLREGGLGDSDGSTSSITHTGIPVFVTTQDVWSIK